MAQPSGHPDSTHKGTLLAKIGQLEADLRHKDTALSHYVKELAQLRGHLAACIQIIQDTSGQLTHANDTLKNRYGQISAHVEGLEKEITALRHSNDAWAKRAVRLEIEALAAQDKVRYVNTERDLAVSTNTQLEKELMAVKAENNALKAQIHNINRG